MGLNNDLTSSQTLGHDMMFLMYFGFNNLVAMGFGNYIMMSLGSYTTMGTF
jgi:hypothetical protein